VAPLAALLESTEVGELTLEKVVSAIRTAMGNSHQQMAQEQRKKLILKLNPSLKIMTEDSKSFVSLTPMLFGEEFAKQATTTVDQVKAMKKLNFNSDKKKEFFRIPPPKLPKELYTMHSRILCVFCVKVEIPPPKLPKELYTLHL